jgi:uncharacterized membrane protein HdeD (DUF308 family)
MDVILSTRWWLLLMRGIAALLLGILIVIFENLPLHELALVFFGYAMIDAVANLAGGITAAERGQSSGLLFLEGAIGFAAAMLIVLWPALPMMALMYIISGWGLATGAVAMVSGARLRRHHRGKWLLAFSGMASIALGVMMIVVPLTGPSTIAFWLGVYAFIFGALLVSLALRLRPAIETHRKLQSRPAA